jgi:hypothetical protein
VASKILSCRAFDVESKVMPRHSGFGVPVDERRFKYMSVLEVIGSRVREVDSWEEVPISSLKVFERMSLSVPSAETKVKATHESLFLIYNHYLLMMRPKADDGSGMSHGMHIGMVHHVEHVLGVVAESRSCHFLVHQDVHLHSLVCFHLQKNVKSTHVLATLIEIVGRSDKVHFRGEPPVSDEDGLLCHQDSFIDVLEVPLSINVVSHIVEDSHRGEGLKGSVDKRPNVALSSRSSELINPCFPLVDITSLELHLSS